MATVIGESLGSVYVLAHPREADELTARGEYVRVDAATATWVVRTQLQGSAAHAEIERAAGGLGGFDRSGEQHPSTLVETLTEDLRRGHASRWVLLVWQRARAGRPTEMPEAPLLSDFAGEEAAVLSWIGVRLLDPRGEPIADMACDLTLPDGSTRSVRTDANGELQIRDIEAGACEAEFPELDETRWERGEE